MNILFYLTRYPGIGGIENVTTQIATMLAVDGNSVSIISHSQQGVVPVALANANLYFMPDDGKYHTAANYEYAEKVISEGMFDAIIYQDSYAPTERIVCPLAKKYLVPLYIFEHNSPMFIYNKRNLEPLFTPMGFLRRVLHPYLLHRDKVRKRYLLKHGKKYVLLSKSFITEFCKLIGKEDERITYINNPIDSIKFTSCSKENIILYVGRLAQEKQVIKLLYIWKQICNQLNDWTLVIVGDGPERPALEKCVVDNNIQRVTFTGFAKPTEYYAKAKIFAMTSKFEGWGLTLVEAMQQGCVPVAWKSFSSVIDIIDNNENGVIVSNNDSTEFMSTLISLARNRSTLEEYSRNGREKVKQFEISKIYQQWLDMLQ